jgi:hypothetical protein
MLLRRIQTLESKVGSGSKDGIVHSVQIRTNANAGNGSIGGVSGGVGADELGHQVNIEIKPTQQQQQRPPPPPPHHRYSYPSPKVSSVVNLVNHHHQQQQQQQGFQPVAEGTRLRTSSFSNAQKPTRPKMIPSTGGRIVVPSSSAAGVGSRVGGRVLSSNRTLNPKSRSVENLFDASQVLGLKAANSEMNVMRSAGLTRHLDPAAAAAQAAGLRHPQVGRLRGTTSEMNVSRIGTNEKVSGGCCWFSGKLLRPN